MILRTPEATSEILSRYKERNTQRLLEPDRLEAEVRGLGDTWFLLRAIEAEGLDINDLRGRFRFLKPLIAQRGYGSQWLADGLHVRDTDAPEFESVKVIKERLSDLLHLRAKNLSYSLGIDEEIAEFTIGAKVLAAAVLDLSSPLLPRESKKLGSKILNSYIREHTVEDIIRVRHVTAGVDQWVRGNHS